MDCALNSFEPGNPNPLYRCRVRKPYPLKKNGELSFTLLFPLDNLISLGEFSANFSLKTAEEDRIHVSQALKVKIKVDYTIRVDRFVQEYLVIRASVILIFSSPEPKAPGELIV